MIVAIDGPAGAGKSSVSRQLAERLGFRFIDTGAMYRAVALAAVRRGLRLQDAEAMTSLASEIRIELDDARVYLDGEDVSAAIRTSEITGLIRYAADNPGVRARMVDLQREIAKGHDVVTEGRDQGTVAFPHAECKIFLTATPEERARRRVQDLAARGESATFDEILRQQNERDHRDTVRAVGPLKRADDAIDVWTDGLAPHEVIDRLEEIVRSRMPAKRKRSSTRP